MITPLASLSAALGDRYRIDREVGRGGMATVYEAEDLKHRRRVAVKVMLPELAAVIGRDRFLREIETTAQLRHAHILPLYDSGEADGSLFYVMPFIEGESLRDRLTREKQLPVDDAVRIAREVADALAYAHARGIVHRDIKPENILLESGHATVADFGIAHVLSEAGNPRLTGSGLSIGSPGYMSPEQAAGETGLDGRSDLYALGCVLYEMLAGQPPFTGPNVNSVVHQHLVAEPPSISGIRPTVPAHLVEAVRRSLAKNPADRFQTAERFIAALDPPPATVAMPAAGGSRRRSRAAWALPLALLFAAVIAFAVWSRRTVSPAARAVPVTLRQVTFSRAVEEYPALSPDGGRLVFSRDLEGRRQLILLDLATGAEQQLTSGEHDNIQSVWTPDGAAVVFVRNAQPGVRLQPGDVFGAFQGAEIWRREIATGEESRLVDDAENPAVSPDGSRIAYDARRSGARRIWVADARGRNALQVTLDSSEAVDHLAPRWSPDGKRIVFQEQEGTRFDIGVVDLATRRTVPVTTGAFLDVSPVWDRSGRAIWFSSYRSGGINLWKVPVAEDGTPAAPPEQITTGAGQDVQLAIPAANGRVAFTVLQLNADLWRLPVDPASGRPTGGPEPVVATTREDSRGAWSPDGRLVAFNSDRGGEMNIWLHLVADGSDAQITRGPGGDYQPRWSPDATRLVFFSARGGNPDIWVVEVATGKLTQLTNTPWLDINPVWSPDGSQIAFQSDRQGRMEQWVMNADGTGQRQLGSTGATGHYAIWDSGGSSLVFAPTGAGPSRVGLAGGELVALGIRGGAHMSWGPGNRMVADVLGHREIWVSPIGGRPYMVFAFEDPEIRIDYPVWSADGRWILFDRMKPEGGDVWVVEEGAAPEARP